MNNKADLKLRTKEFAHRCVRLSVSLPENTLGRHVKGQLIRCSTSVAANYRAASIAHSKKSFIAKLSIAFEEADESSFWLEFIVDEGLMKPKRVQGLLKEAEELTAIFAASRITARKNQDKK